MQEGKNESASAEQLYSRTLRHEKYMAMQLLLLRLKAEPANAPVGEYPREAADILAGMQVPRSSKHRALDRVMTLESLQTAYATVAALSGKNEQAATVMLEALKAWEREHAPQPLDPALL